MLLLESLDKFPKNVLGYAFVDKIFPELPETFTKFWKNKTYFDKKYQTYISTIEQLKKNKEINVINTEEILPAITSVPKSFTKLIINFKIAYSVISLKRCFKNIVYKETDYQYTDEYMEYVEATQKLYIKSIIDTFSTRFPQIIIEEINK